MNWTQFLYGIATIYVVYYLLNLAFDALGQTKTVPPNDSGRTLDFETDELPRKIGPSDMDGDLKDSADAEETSGTISVGQLQSTGGVSIRELFSLAQSDLISYTGAITY